VALNSSKLTGKKVKEATGKFGNWQFLEASEDSSKIIVQPLLSCDRRVNVEQNQQRI